MPRLRSRVAALHGDVWSRAGTHKESTTSCTMHRHAIAAVPASCCTHRGEANRHRRNTPGCSCRREALPAFHGLVQSIPIRDVDQCASAVKCRKRRDMLTCFLGPEKAAQSCFDKLGHRAFLTRGFPLQLRHDCVVDIQRCLHMENHINETEVLQCARGRLS